MGFEKSRLSLELSVDPVEAADVEWAGQRTQSRGREAIPATRPSECCPHLLAFVGALEGRLGALAAQRSHVERQGVTKVLGQLGRTKATPPANSAAIWPPSSSCVFFHSRRLSAETPSLPHPAGSFLTGLCCFAEKLLPRKCPDP